MTIELIDKLLTNDKLELKDIEELAKFVSDEIDIVEAALKEANSPLSKTTCDEHMKIVKHYCNLNKIYERIIYKKYEKEDN